MSFKASEKELKKLEVRGDPNRELIRYLSKLSQTIDAIALRNNQNTELIIAKLQSLTKIKSPDVSVVVDQEKVVDCIKEMHKQLSGEIKELREAINKKRDYEFDIDYDRANMISKVIAKEK